MTTSDASDTPIDPERAAGPGALVPGPFTLVPADPDDAVTRAAIEGLLRACGLPSLKEDDDALVLVVIRHADGSLLGFAAHQRRGNTALVRCLAVAPQARSCGVGSALMTGILRQMIAAGIQSVAVLALGGQGFFSRFGFLAVMPADLPPLLLQVGHLQRADLRLAGPMLLDLRGATLVMPAERFDMPTVLAIYNDAVAQSTATYDYEPRGLDEQLALFDHKMVAGYCFHVARTPDGTVAGFATYGPYRTRPGWRFACEHSVYVAAPWRGLHVGLSLLPPIMQHARKNGFHTMVAVIDAENAASLRMHRRAGFVDIGTMREGGYKFGRWLDVAFLQAML